jgi:hypothetical protein
MIEANAVAKAGTYASAVRASTTYNGQPLNVNPELTFIIETAVTGQK